MISKQVGILCVAVAGVAAAVALSMASCAQTPPNVTLRTFRQAQKVDVVCMQVLDPSTQQPISPPVPLPQNQCVPVPAGANGATMPNHLYAVVTQTTPGALAVVDLTAGSIIDVDVKTPGVDFIPVGANPTDVAVTPDGKYTYVSSADPTKMAIYQIDNTRLLGNSLVSSSMPLRLGDLGSCALPQAPQALTTVPAVAPDDSGASPTSYVPVVVLRGVAGGAGGGGLAAVATVDPNSMMPPGSLPTCALRSTALSNEIPSSSGLAPAWSDGVPYADAGDLFGQEPSPGPQCSWPPPEDGGVVPGGEDDGSAGEAGSLDAGQPGLPSPNAHPTSIALRSDIPLLYVADDSVPVIHVIDLQDPTNPRELQPLLAASNVDLTRRVAVGGIAVSPPTHDYQTFLYAIDSMQGTLMVYDVTDPETSPHVPLLRPHPELNPFAPVDRLGFSAPAVAVAFVQHDWPVPSQKEPAPAIHQYTGLLCNPNPNAISDSGTVLDAGAYYRADYAQLIQSMVTNGGTVQGFPSRLRGVFAFVTLSNGNLVTIDVDDWDAPCRRPDPMAMDSGALPGVAAGTTGMPGVLAIPQTAGDSDDLDPYHAPYAFDGGTGPVTLETFFPVSAPHRIRSAFLLRQDTSGGAHAPNLVATPQLFNGMGAPVITSGSTGVQSPLLQPTPLPPGFFYPPYVQNPIEPDPTKRLFSGPLLADGGLAPPFPSDVTRGAPGVRLSFDDPTAPRDQDWTVTYEGALPTVNPGQTGIVADVASAQPEELDGGTSNPDAYQTLRLSAPGARFCARGIEDWDIGQARAGQMLMALSAAGLAVPSEGSPQLPALPPAQMGDAGLAPAVQPNLQQWTSDYVEIVDDLLSSTDPYWSQPSSVNACWENLDPSLSDDKDPNVGMNRYNACFQRFGAATDSDTHLWRDLPIIHAKDESLEVGRFAWYDTATDSAGNTVSVPEQTTNRVVVGADPSNEPFLRITRCCFHHQASFKVRAGGEWLAVGSNVGMLHHVKKDASGACVLSCDPRDVLSSARSFDIPWWQDGTCTANPAFDPNAGDLYGRNTALAMRNPMMSYIVWSGCGPPNGFGDHTLTTRDLSWRFSTTGSFSPQTLSLTSATTGNAVSPQSMRFIPSLGQLAVVDGEAQGLVLIDLNLVTVVHNYY